MQVQKSITMQFLASRIVDFAEHFGPNFKGLRGLSATNIRKERDRRGLLPM